MSRHIDLARCTSESAILEEFAAGKRDLNTSIAYVKPNGGTRLSNPIHETVIGRYRQADARKNITVDVSLIEKLQMNGRSVPVFYEAGPRKALSFHPSSVKAAILTAGGIAPGLHSAIHAIVQRHRKVYKMNKDEGGRCYAIPDGFLGLCRQGQHLEDLGWETTKEWLALGGSQLGSVRYYGEQVQPKHADNEAKRRLAEMVASTLRRQHIDILYVLGGDGSMGVAHQIAMLVPEKSIACVPKTMDNDILWVTESFGFSTAVEEATRVINTLHREAVSTRRICIIELFGAESGFVAANAALASGKVDLVLVPEAFQRLVQDVEAGGGQFSLEALHLYWNDCVDHIRQRVRGESKDSHAVIEVAEGVSTVLQVVKDHPGFSSLSNLNAVDALKKDLEGCENVHGLEVQVFVNRPGHNIRAVPANSHDQIYCERLGALAVDNALAGYTDFMVSQWMTEYVLVPLELATLGQKSIPLDGVFWKQVMNITGQPTHEKHCP